MTATLSAIHAFVQSYPSESVAIIVGILGFILLRDIRRDWSAEK